MTLVAALVAVNEIAPAEAAWVRTPFCVNEPPNVKPKVPVPIFEVPNTVAILFVSETLFAPELLSNIAPVKALPVPLVDKLIVLAPAVNVEVPVTVNAPDCEIAPPLLVAESVPPIVAAPNDNAPVLLAERFPPIVSEARVNAPTSVIVTLLTPEFERVTAPVNALFAPLVVKLMVLCQQ